MTSEEFQSRYRLLTQVSDGEVRSYHAIAPSGTVVMVHCLTGRAGEEHHPLLSLIEGLPPDKKEKVLKVMEVDGSPVVVTKFVLEFDTLPAWLGAAETRAQTAAEAASEPEDAATEGSDSPAGAPGEFTQLFRIPPPGPTPPPARASVDEPPPLEHPRETPVVGPEPESARASEASTGEFTQLFRRPTIEQAQMPASLPLRGSTGDTQEFTNLFGIPAAESAAASEPSAAERSLAPREADTLLPSEQQEPTAGSSPAPRSPRESAASPAPGDSSPAEPDRASSPLPGRRQSPSQPLPASTSLPPPGEPLLGPEVPRAAGSEETGRDGPGRKEPGELTRIFQRAELPAAPPTSPQATESTPHADSASLPSPPFEAGSSSPPPRVDYTASYRDRLQGGTPAKRKPAGSAAPASDPPPPSFDFTGGAGAGPPPAAPPQPVRGPSEYTKVIAAQQPPLPVEPRPPAPPPRPAPLPPRRGPSLWLLRLGLGFVFLAALALMLYFVLTTVVRP